MYVRKLSSSRTRDLARPCNAKFGRYQQYNKYALSFSFCRPKYNQK